MKKQKYMGSTFDDFLEEEGILEEVESVAAVRVFDFQMQAANKSEPALDDFTGDGIVEESTFFGET